MKFRFYKARGNIYDQAIRFWTGKYVFRPAKYSHVEMEFSNGLCISASPRDTPAGAPPGQRGGVREKLIEFDPGKWDAWEFPMAPEVEAAVLRWARSQIGRPYDWAGIKYSQFLRLGIHRPDAYFCSEFAAHGLLVALEFPLFDTANPCLGMLLRAPHRISPIGLHEAIDDCRLAHPFGVPLWSFTVG
jgi:hypothetical protein